MQRSSKRPQNLPAQGLIGELAGEYRILRELGSGAFGTVYEAEHPVLGRRAAVKVLHEAKSLDDVAVQRFIAEAKAASQIRHRNIVDIFSFGELSSGRLFYVMDLLDGVPLDVYLAERGMLAPEIALAIVRPVAFALDALHSAQVIHRDVKPANIFLAWESSGEVVPKLLDFGLIKLLDNSPISTASNVLMGTPYYMAPEQCQGKTVDARTDVYALGVIYHELCTGTVPFVGESASAVLIDHVLKPPPRMTDSRSELPGLLDAPVLAMLAKDPENRPASAEAAYKMLAQALIDSGRTLAPSPLELERPAARAKPPDTASTGRTQSVAPHERNASGITHRRIPSALVLTILAIGLGGLTILLPMLLRKSGDVAPADSALANDAPQASASGGSEVASTRQVPTGSALSASSAPVATPARVHVVLRGAPRGARVRQGEHALGAASSPLVLPRGEGPVVLTVEAPGHESKTLSVLPDRDLEIDATLEPSKRPAAQRPAPPKRVSSDLENPF